MALLHRRILATRSRKVASKRGRPVFVPAWRADPCEPRGEPVALASVGGFWDDRGFAGRATVIAMSTRQFLIGCMLALGGIGAAAAVEVDTQDLANSQHATIDAAASHENSGSTSDASASPGCHIDCSRNDASTGINEVNGTGVTAHPPTSHRTSLGWQSLLPGSIQ